MADHEKKVKKLLGEAAWDMLIEEVNAYRIKKQHMVDVAELLGVGGNHKRRMDGKAEPDQCEWRRILSDWFGIRGLEVNDKNRQIALMELSEVFFDKSVSLNPLGKDLKTMANMEKKQLPPARSILSREKIQSMMTPATATPATVSNQGNFDTCASHSLGAAIQDILHRKQFDADQERITTSLQETFPQGPKVGRNPDEFKGKEIAVQERNGGGRVVKIKIILDTVDRTKLNSNIQDFSQAAVFFKNDEFQAIRNMDIAMVLRWSLGPKRNHAIYAKSYDSVTNVFSCINSWGPTDNPTPTIHDSRIYAIDFVQFEAELIH